MSIQYHREDCFLLSHQAKLNDIYLAAVDEGHHNIAGYTYDNPHRNGHLKTFEVNARLFEINTCYDERPAISPTASIPTTDVVTGNGRVRRRKRNRQTNNLTAEADEDSDIEVLREMQQLV